MTRPEVDSLETLSRELDALGRGLAEEKASALPGVIDAVVRHRRSRWVMVQAGVGAAIGAAVVAGVVGAVVLLNASPTDGPFVKPKEKPKTFYRERIRDQVPMDAPSSMASLRKATKGTEGAAMLEKLPVTGGGDGEMNGPLLGEKEK